MLNLTPHAITLVIDCDGKKCQTVVPPSGTVARVAMVERLTGRSINGIPVIERIAGEVTGLPENGELCLVSSMVLSACQGRQNVFAPDTGPTAIRDDKGNIVAVTRLVQA